MALKKSKEDKDKELVNVAVSAEKEPQKFDDINNEGFKQTVDSSQSHSRVNDLLKNNELQKKIVQFGGKTLTLFSLDGLTWSSRAAELTDIKIRHENERLSLNLNAPKQKPVKQGAPFNKYRKAKADASEEENEQGDAYSSKEPSPESNLRSKAASLALDGLDDLDDEDEVFDKVVDDEDVGEFDEEKDDDVDYDENEHDSVPKRASEKSSSLKKNEKNIQKKELPAKAGKATALQKSSKLKDQKNDLTKKETALSAVEKVQGKKAKKFTENSVSKINDEKVAPKKVNREKQSLKKSESTAVVTSKNVQKKNQPTKDKKNDTSSIKSVNTAKDLEKSKKDLSTPVKSSAKNLKKKNSNTSKQVQKKGSGIRKK
jgi:hypothetical protein